MIEEDFCIDCEELIVLPNKFNFFGNKSPVPVRFKKGWKCGYCYEKTRRKK